MTAEFAGFFFRAGDLGLGVDGQVLFLQDLLEAAGHFFIAAGDEGGEHFEDGDLGAEAGPDGAQFEADGAAADDDHSGGDFVEGDGLVGTNDAFAVELHEGEFGRGGTGGNDDVFGGEFAGAPASGPSTVTLPGVPVNLAAPTTFRSCFSS